MDTGSSIPSASETEMRERRSEAAHQLARLSPEEVSAHRLKAEINEMDRVLGRRREHERAALIEALVRNPPSSLHQIPFTELPEHISMVERLRGNAMHRLERQQPGIESRSRTEADLEGLESELAFYRTMIGNPDLYREVQSRSQHGMDRTPSHHPRRPIYLGLASLLIGLFMFLPTLLVAGTGRSATVLGQVTVGFLVVGVLLLIAGVINSRTS